MSTTLKALSAFEHGFVIAAALANYVFLVGKN